MLTPKKMESKKDPTVDLIGNPVSEGHQPPKQPAIKMINHSELLADRPILSHFNRIIIIGFAVVIAICLLAMLVVHLRPQTMVRPSNPSAARPGPSTQPQ